MNPYESPREECDHTPQVDSWLKIAMSMQAIGLMVMLSVLVSGPLFEDELSILGGLAAVVVEILSIPFIYLSESLNDPPSA